MEDQRWYCPSPIDSSCYEPTVCSEYDNETTNGKGPIQKTSGKRDESTSSVYTIKRTVDGKRKKINLFNTEIRINSCIINAATGFPYVDDNMKPYRVGSNDELFFFKVRFLSYEENVPGITLFFDSPEHYERHMKDIIPEKEKRAHYDRRISYENKTKRVNRQ
jgi:hypothetical protein